MTTLTSLKQDQPARYRMPLIKPLASLGLLAFLAAGLSACATSPAFFERGGLGPEANADADWAGAAKPRPVAATSTVRLGSQPLLPPVPDRQDGLAPIKMTAYAD